MKKFIYIFFTILALASCSDFDNLNDDPKNPIKVPAEPLFTNATRDLVDLMCAVNVNTNVFKLYSQYWSQCTYPNESQYNMVTRRNPDNWWTTLYRDVLKDYNEAAKILGEESAVGVEAQGVKKNKLAILTTMEVYAYSILVDTFGDVPYSQAFDEKNILPKYDKAVDVYNSIIDKLDKAIADYNLSYKAFDSKADLVYEGDVSKWLKFAYSLKLRLAIRIADANSTKAATMIADAATKVMLSNDDNFSMTYFVDPPNTNPMWADLVQSGRLDFSAANTIVDIMNGLNDPRRSAFFSEISSGVYKGGTYGLQNDYDSFSHFGSLFYTPDLSGTLLGYSEVCYLLAEAKERGFAITGNAADYYKNAIQASFDEWKVSGFTAYYSQSSVDYSTAQGSWKQKIGTQKWIALFNQGFDGWTSWRQLDYPKLNVVPNLTYGDIPSRFIYPIAEATLNGTNRNEAAKNYNNDSPKARIFWDVVASTNN